MNQRRARKNSNSDVPSGQWDAEEDHLLSYFLGSDGHRSNSHGSLPSLAEGPEHESGQGRSRRDYQYSQAQPPPTPAMQFYYSHHGASPSSSKGGTSPALGSVRGAPPATAVSASSSSSSLSSMAAHLVSGGPVVHQMMTTTTSTSSKKEGGISPIDLHNHPSPISPAAIIGAGNENLMLPPPPRYPAQSGSTATSATPYPKSSTEHSQPQHPTVDPEQQQRHMAWLQQINSLAMSAQRQQQQQQQHTMGGAVPAPPLQPPPGGGMPGFPVAAAGRHHPGMVPLAVASSGVGGVAPPLAPSPVFPTAATGGMPQQMPPPPATPTSSSTSTASGGTTPGTSGESAERRARRLARNRESARQSRLRKKTRLKFLGEKVNRLHTEIETERGRKLMEMEPSLYKVRSDKIAQLVSHLQQQQQDTTMDEGTTTTTEDDEEVKDLLMSLVQETSPNCAVRRAAVTFQYNSLKQLLLPKYQEFLLWLTLHPEKFFLAGKIEQAKKTEGQLTKASPGRLSSKQIGEEITNEYKSKQQGSASSKKTKKDDDSKSENQEADNLTCAAWDAPRMWPLLCYELSVSVDQEEKLLQAQKRARQMPNLPNARSQMAVATRMATSMKNGVLYQSHAAALRSENLLLRILTPEQSIKYLEWFAANRDRCRAVLDRQQQRNRSSDAAASDSQKETSLSEVCRRLEEMMRTPKDEE